MHDTQIRVGNLLSLKLDGELLALEGLSSTEPLKSLERDEHLPARLARPVEHPPLAVLALALARRHSLQTCARFLLQQVVATHVHKLVQI